MKIDILPQVSSVKCGEYHSIALITKYSKCYVWGNNSCGQLGLGIDID